MGKKQTADALSVPEVLKTPVKLQANLKYSDAFYRDVYPFPLPLPQLWVLLLQRKDSPEELAG